MWRVVGIIRNNQRTPEAGLESSQLNLTGPRRQLPRREPLTELPDVVLPLQSRATSRYGR